MFCVVLFLLETLRGLEIVTGLASKKKSHEEEFELFLQSMELFTKESVGLFLSRRPRGSRMPSRSSRLVMPHEDRIGRTRKVWTRNLLELGARPQEGPPSQPRAEAEAKKAGNKDDTAGGVTRTLSNTSTSCRDCASSSLQRFMGR